MEKLNARECIRFGWETFRKRPWILIGGFVLAMAVSGLSSALLDPGEGAPFTMSVAVMMVLSAIIGLLVEIGLVNFSLRAHDAVESVGVKDLWNPAPFIWYLLGQILVGLAVLIGFILLIVPGIILMLGLMFASYLIVDKGRGPIEAMKESWAMTKGHKWQLLSLSLLVIGINLLGVLALVVGLLVSVPVSMLAVVHAYRKLANAAPVQTA